MRQAAAMIQITDFDHIHFAELDSTNAEAERRLAKDDITRPSLITTDIQTDGRGSRGRSWTGLRGNIFASFVFPGAANWTHPHLATYATALAIGNTAKRFTNPDRQVTLKWPNDVLVDGKKISGCLLSGVGYGTDRSYVIGIGINVAAHPDGDLNYRAGHLQQYCASEISRDQVLETLAKQLSYEIQDWLSNGFDGVKRRYLSNAFPIGTPVTFKPRGDAEMVTGAFDGIQSDGALMLQTPSGPKTFHAGDIFPSLISEPSSN